MSDIVNKTSEMRVRDILPTETKSDKDFRRLNESSDLRLPETKSFRISKVSGVSGSLAAAAAAVTAFHLIVFFTYRKVEYL